MKPRRKSISANHLDARRRKRRIGVDDRKAFELRFALALGALTMVVGVATLLIFR